MDKKPHLVNRSTVCANKRNGGFTTRPFCVSGFGDLQMKRMPYGGMSFAGNLGGSRRLGFVCF